MVNPTTTRSGNDPLMHKRALLLVSVLFGCDADEGPMSAGEVAYRCGFVGEVGLVGLDSVDISGNPSIFGPHASVFSNESITLSGSFEVEGYAISGGTVSTSGSGSLGGVIENATRISVFDPTAAVAAAAVSNDNAKVPCVKKGNKCTPALSGTSLALSGQSTLELPAGKYYFTSLQVSGQARIDVAGAVVIYMNGPVSFNGGSATNPASDSLSIVSKHASEIKLTGSSEARTSIHAPFATVRFSGTNGFRGSVISKHLSISGTADLEPVGNLTTVYSASCGNGGADDGGGVDGGGADGGGADGGGADAGGPDGGGADAGGPDGGGADGGGADGGGADGGGADDHGTGGAHGDAGDGNGDGDDHLNRDQPCGDTDTPE
jgi:hypothetical protein